MVDAQLAETVAVKACNACQGGLLEQDKFCRWCGSPQTCLSQTHLPQTYLLSPATACPEQASSYSLSPYTTSALSRAAIDSRPYRRVSGPLVRALIAGVAGGRAQEIAGQDPAGRVVRSMVQALISIPIWLMIVLLSPIDAYVAAKSISREF